MTAITGLEGRQPRFPSVVSAWGGPLVEVRCLGIDGREFPWPVCTTVSSGSTSRRSRIDSMINGSRKHESRIDEQIDKAVTRSQKVLQKQMDADAALLKKEIETAETQGA
jgi:hypothetical protein